MTVEMREDGFIKNAKTNRWLKPGSRSYIAYMKEHGETGNVAMEQIEPIEPVQSQEVAKPQQVAKAASRKSKAQLEVAPELSDDEIHTTLTESDFKSALDIVQEKLKGLDSFQPIQVDDSEKPKTRKPRKPRVKKE